MVSIGEVWVTWLVWTVLQVVWYYAGLDEDVIGAISEVIMIALFSFALTIGGWLNKRAHQ